MEGSVLTGYLSVTPVANQITAVEVQFDKPFPYIPKVIVNPTTSVPGTTVQGCSAGSITKDGFTLYLLRTNTTATGINWVAISADGQNIETYITTSSFTANTTKAVSHYFTIDPDIMPASSYDDDFLYAIAEWTIRSPKGKVLLSGFKQFKRNSSSYSTNGSISTDFSTLVTEGGSGDYILTYEVDVPSKGLRKVVNFVKVNANGTIADIWM